MFMIVGMLFSVSVSAATMSISNVSTSGGGAIDGASGVTGATATHTGLISDFIDVWKVTAIPSVSSTFNIATSIPTFETFNAFFSLDNTVSSVWTNFTTVAEMPSIFKSQTASVSGQLSTYFIKVVGSGIPSGSSSYQLSVSAVPVPAALFLFAPALLGFFGLRRKAAAAA